MNVWCSVFQFLAEAIHDAETSNAALRPIDVITHVSKVFDFADIKSFIQVRSDGKESLDIHTYVYIQWFRHFVRYEKLIVETESDYEYICIQF